MIDLLKMVIFRSCVELPEGYKNGDFIADYIIQYPQKQNTKPVKHGVQKQSVYHLQVVSTHLRRRRVAASHLG